MSIPPLTSQVKETLLSDFNERKIVKTISLRKKVAAVAVASLGFGLLSAVPAKANLTTLADEPANLTVFAASSTTPVTVSGTTAVVVPVFVGASAALTATKGFTVVGTLVTKPVGAADPTIAAALTGADSGVFVAMGTNTANRSQSQVYSTTGIRTLANGTSGGTLATITGGIGSKVGEMTLTGFDKPGIYTFAITPNGAGTDVAATVTVRAGFSADSVRANKMFPTQGINTTTGWTGTGGGQATVRLTGFPAAGGTYYATVTGSGTLNSVTEGDADSDLSHTPTNGVNLLGGATIVADGTTNPSAYEDLGILLGASGSATVTVVTFDASTGQSTTFASATVTIGSADLLNVSVANTTIYKAKSNDAPSSSTDSTAIVQSAAVGTQRANILVTIKNGNNVALVDQNVSATISGPGLIAWSASGTGTGTTAGTVVKDMGDSEHEEYLVVNGSGAGGVATITFAIGTTVLGTETITFYGAASKYTATTNIVAAANGTTSTDVVTVCATDSANVAVPDHTIYGFSGDTTVASMAESSDATETSAIAASGTSMADHVAATAIGCVGFSITALTQTTKPSVVLTFGDASTIATSTITTTATVLVGSVAATTITLSSDKTTYAPGAAVVLTLTYKDSVGRPVAHGPGTDTLAAALTSSSALGTAALFGTANSSKLGTTSQTVYAPLQGGPVTVSGKTGTGSTQTYVVLAANGIALSTTFSVTDANAAIATSIAALNAKIVALNALIAKIMKRLNIR
jgi:hypothetical protein